ncbi:hypothetical protein ACHQM5_006279 [Ranunculus cassubicifolius]
MAEVVAEITETTTTTITTETTESKTENMEVETLPIQNGESKRSREESETNGSVDDESINKKQKVEGEEEKSVEEERLEEEVKKGPVDLGPKSFGSSEEMFNYFHKFVHYWPMNFDINQYEHMVLMELLKKGHPEPEKKIGAGIRAFQVRNHPMFKSRCFFIAREDDFRVRKCIDRILPLPEAMKVQLGAKKALLAEVADMVEEEVVVVAV